ncbi:unnamed protein product [Mycena citricolor]|uniref:DUF6534 domain-containing protein n=1 Tax=Mycena citricolor TaxID=2018698 RepID=A0AAD2H9A3_9AGAR|nr:unnamed protein product [Mycena citricolor]
MARTNLYNTLGAYEIGLALSTLLFGVESLQTFYYYRRYAKDPLVLKILVSPVSAAAAAPLRLTARTQVAVIWIFGLTQSICAWHALFLMSVTFFGEASHITTSPPTSLTLNALVSTVLFVLVQGFFCLRIRTVSGSRALAAGCFALALLPLALYAYVAALLFRSGFAATADPRGPGHVVMTVAAAVLPLANILVSAVLCWGLWRMRGQRAFQRTNSIIDTIILWTVETTAITSVVAVLELIMDITAGKTRLSFEHSGFYILIHSAAVLWIIFFFLHGKLQSNTVLASLNSRGSHATDRWAISTSGNGGASSTGRRRGTEPVMLPMTHSVAAKSDLEAFELEHAPTRDSHSEDVKISPSS